jgi:hypothetical protein
MILKITPKNFQINLTLELFICLMLELLEFILNCYSLRTTFFCKICDFKVLTNFYVFNFFLEFSLFKKNSPTRIAKLKKFETKKTCWLWGII